MLSYNLNFDSGDRFERQPEEIRLKSAWNKGILFVIFKRNKASEKGQSFNEHNPNYVSTKSYLTNKISL